MSALYREIAVATFEREWRAINNSVFNGCPAHEQPFLHTSWERILVPYGLYMEPDVFDALSRGARQVRDEDLVIWNSEAIEPQPAVSIPWSHQALDQVRSTLLGHFETHVFGRSGSWGMVCTVNDFSCVGGEATFMDIFVATLRGREAIRERFLRFAATEWRVSKQFRRKVFKIVGWE